jgi:hypothetical protein
MALTRHQPAEYHSYLLRLWRNGPQETWRASMQCTATSEFHHFASIEHLVNFLQAQSQRGEAPVTQTPDRGNSSDLTII